MRAYFGGENFILGIMAVALLAGCGKTARPVQASVPRVVITTPEQRAVLEYEDLPGRIDATEDVEVKARVNGYLNTIEFKEGTEVKKGDLLFTIDPREYQAEVESATASVQQAQAKLAQAQSDYERANMVVKKSKGKIMPQVCRSGPR